MDLEIAADNARADALGLTLDSDPRKTTSNGQRQTAAGAQAGWAGDEEQPQATIQ